MDLLRQRPDRGDRHRPRSWSRVRKPSRSLQPPGRLPGRGTRDRRGVDEELLVLEDVVPALDLRRLVPEPREEDPERQRVLVEDRGDERHRLLVESEARWQPVEGHREQGGHAVLLVGRQPDERVEPQGSRHLVGEEAADGAAADPAHDLPDEPPVGEGVIAVARPRLPSRCADRPGRAVRGCPSAAGGAPDPADARAAGGRYRGE